MKKVFLLALASLTLVACGQSEKREGLASTYNPQLSGPKPESAADFNRRCLQGDGANKGQLYNNKTICLMPIYEFVMTENQEFTDQVTRKTFGNLPAGSIVSGFFDGPSPGPTLWVGSTAYGPGNIARTYTGDAATMVLEVPGGRYKQGSYFASYCYSQGNSHVNCPNPLVPN